MRIKQGISTWGFALLAVLALSGPRVGAEELNAAQRVILEVSDRVQTVLVESGERLASDPDYVYELVDEVLLPHVDMERVSSLILGRHWRQATPEQRQGFMREFKRMLVRTYATALHEVDAWEIRFPPSRGEPRESGFLVQTQLVRAGAQPVAVDYQMHLRDGRWRAYDVKIEGISLITNYRSSFARLIQTRGMDGLIDELAQTNARKAGIAREGLAGGKQEHNS
jgi:phospholipid transport system substrate-binding protein